MDLLNAVTVAHIAASRKTQRQEHPYFVIIDTDVLVRLVPGWLADHRGNVHDSAHGDGRPRQRHRGGDELPFFDDDISVREFVGGSMQVGGDADDACRWEALAGVVRHDSDL
jgi:hypothetical protein